MIPTETPTTTTAWWRPPSWPIARRAILVALALLAAMLAGMVVTAEARNGSADVTIRPGQTAVFHIHGEWFGCAYWKGEAQCSYADGTPVMTTSTGRRRIRGMQVYLGAGGSVNVKSVHVPANKTYTGNGPQDDTVWTFR
jgi:hypothetical protein